MCQAFLNMNKKKTTNFSVKSYFGPPESNNIRREMKARPILQYQKNKNIYFKQKVHNSATLLEISF